MSAVVSKGSQIAGAMGLVVLKCQGLGFRGLRTSGLVDLRFIAFKCQCKPEIYQNPQRQTRLRPDPAPLTL